MGGEVQENLLEGSGGEKGQVHCDLNFAVKQLTKKEFKKRSFVK